MAISERLATLLREISAAILEAQKPVRVMRALDWPAEVEHAFFARGATELPRPSYSVPPGVVGALDAFQALADQTAEDSRDAAKRAILP